MRIITVMTLILLAFCVIGTLMVIYGYSSRFLTTDFGVTACSSSMSYGGVGMGQGMPWGESDMYKYGRDYSGCTFGVLSSHENPWPAPAYYHASNGTRIPYTVICSDNPFKFAYVTCIESTNILSLPWNGVVWENPQHTEMVTCRVLIRDVPPPSDSGWPPYAISTYCQGQKITALK